MPDSRHSMWAGITVAEGMWGWEITA